ncbi:ComEC/Rec2 family competence protein [Helicobacter sp. MIT 14-3879]|uniref:ComEC/Rec2 family competence protein n=1 Tax=Helicobacter sp. MIT 14-3879 TaxID=2040649 RepID=UPI000E1F6193|nr:ComEC/Rec2 family competence protein [Helicobacter sp. MIT 14-3879]RDU62670.1 DNA transfer protein [Helicobacter sp. MIT 14-3879]
MKSIQSPFDIDLLSNKREWILFITISLLIFCIAIFIEYRNYKDFVEAKNINAEVLLQYKKDSKYVLKLKSDNGSIFYTTSKDDLKDIRGRFVNIYGKATNDCTFYKYLRNCFFIGYSISLLHKREFAKNIIDYINSQHLSKTNNLDSALYIESKVFDEFNKNIFAQMYQSLFLAKPMPQDLRDITNIFGVAHIFAISGFHLGILSFVLYFFLKFPYRYFQRNYFTYRNEFYDLNFVILIFAFIYLNILSFSPSFLRSFVMFAFGFFVLWKGLKLLSFKLLFACGILILSLFPRIFFSIAFWLSFSGIFYIYLYLKYFKLKNKLLYGVLLNIIVFLNMLPISHYIFYDFSLYAILSPFITMLFIIFYPLVLILHIFGFGGIFDNILSLILYINFSSFELQTPFWFLCIFLCVSFIAIFNKFVYYFSIFLSSLYFLYGFLKGVL